MTPEKVAEICADYKAAMRQRYGAMVAERMDAKYAERTHNNIPDHVVQRHLYFVATEIPVLMEQGRVEKAMRWLGWLQGAMWARSFETLEAAKLRNAPVCGSCGRVQAQDSAQADSGRYCCKGFGTSDVCHAYGIGGSR